MEPKHTPGPWHVKLGKQGESAFEEALVCPSIWAQDDSWVIISEVDGPDLSTAQANARLIAEAPAMRAMLDRLLSEWLKYSEFESDARALLTRIDGGR